MQFILVSACLLGSPVRYNGTHKRSDHDILQQWVGEGRVVPICPEIAGGLPVPRPPAEIVGAAGGVDVLAGLARVMDPDANDISASFVAGAAHALHQAQHRGIRVAVLKEGSPSCGSGYIYDGTFTGTRVPRSGVTAALLASAGVTVFSEEQFAEANELLCELESGEY